MKHLNTIALALLAPALLYSCKKNDDTTQSVTPVNTEIDKAKLQGKWLVTSHYQLYYDANGNITGGEGASETYHQYNVDPLPPSVPKSYITFNGDNSYDLTDGNGNPGGSLLDFLLPNHGQWALKNGNTVLNVETKAATLGKPNIDYQSVAFKDSYLHVIYLDSNASHKTIWHLELQK
jgi:hypothetical protein